MSARVFNTTLKEIKDLDDRQIRLFRLAVPAEAAFSFRAGQYVIVRFDDTEKPLKGYFSIASPPSWPGLVELCCKKTEGGGITEKLWQLHEGDSVTLEGPSGNFGLKEPLKQQLVFAGMGSGIAPLRSMIHEVLEKKYAVSRIVNLLGCCYPSAILFRQEFEALARKHPHLENLFTVSRTEPGHVWQGPSAYVQELLPQVITDAGQTAVYVCGSKEMVQETEKRALELGVDAGNILYEKY